MKQRGYFSIDFGAVFAVAIAIGCMAGFFVAYAIPIVWGWIKPLIHAATA